MSDAVPSDADVFLSYAREDEARVGELATALDRHEFSVFWDREVPPGATWRSYIGKALDGAKCVVVVWSRHSIELDFVIEEASKGQRRGVLVPVLFEAVQIPLGFGGIQAVSLVDWQAGRPSPAFDALLGAVRRMVGRQASSGTEPASPVEPSQEPPRPPPAPARGRSHHSLASMMIAGLIVIAGLGAAGVYWLQRPPWSALEPAAGPATVPPQPKPTTAPEPPVKAKPPAASAEGSRAPSAGEVAKKHRTTLAAVGSTFKDCPDCPKMVVVPPGAFTMGSPSNEPGRQTYEGPQRKVTIPRAFAVGKYEVTFAEWDACVAGGGCRHYTPADQGWGRGNQPVINVSWNDAQEYVTWLSKEAGEIYRLPTEAEWEYVARAKSTTAYWWGDEIGRGNANCMRCGGQWGGKQAAPVGSFRANPFGLYDTAGNVWEWVQDCWHDTYQGAPRDGSAWTTADDGDCSKRVLRGGSWNRDPAHARSAWRSQNGPDYREADLNGFRVVAD